MRLYAVLCMCGIFKNTLHKLRGWGGSGGSGVMCILNSLQHSPEMCVFFPQRNVSPSLQPLRCLSVCHLDCSSVTSDVISVYLSLFATFPNSRSVSWVPLSHCMTIHSPNPICPWDKQCQGLSRCFKKGVTNRICRKTSDTPGGADPACATTRRFGIILYTHLQTGTPSPVYMDRYFRLHPAPKACVYITVDAAHV